MAVRVDGVRGREAKRCMSWATFEFRASVKRQVFRAVVQVDGERGRVAKGV